MGPHKCTYKLKCKTDRSIKLKQKHQINIKRTLLEIHRKCTQWHTVKVETLTVFHWQGTL